MANFDKDSKKSVIVLKNYQAKMLTSVMQLSMIYTKFQYVLSNGLILNKQLIKSIRYPCFLILLVPNTLIS